MKKFNIAILAITVALAAALFSVAAFAANIASCQTITISGNYILTQSISKSAGTGGTIPCITINASGVTLDCNGYTITVTENPPWQAIGVSATAKNNTIVKNCKVYVFGGTGSSNSPSCGCGAGAIGYGIYFSSVNNGSILNNLANGTGGVGGDNLGEFGECGAGCAGANGEGILLSGSNNITIVNNSAVGNGGVGGGGDAGGGGSGAGIGIDLSSASSNTLANNSANSSSSYGLLLSGSSNNVVTSSIARLNGAVGIYLSGGGSNTISNNNLNGPSQQYGLYLSSSSNNNLTNNSLSSNSVYGVYLGASSNNIFLKNNATGNTEWDVYSASSSTGNIFTNLTTQRNLVSFISKDIALKGLTTTGIPANPSGYKNISKYLNMINNAGDSWIYLNVSYSSSDVPADVAENTLKIWKNNASGWTQVSGINSVDSVSRIVYANITAFGSTFGVFGQTVGAYTSPTDSFTSGLAANGSVNGTLSNGTHYTSNQDITLLNTTSGRKYFMASANFSGANVDFSSLKIETSAGKIAVNNSGLAGSYGAHTLWLPNSNNNGVYACPNALAVSAVTNACSGALAFSGDTSQFPQTQSGITVSVDGSYWQIAGLTGSGSGENSPSMPSAPSGLTAIANNASSINLSWIDASSTEYGFQVYRSLDNSSFSWVVNLTINSTAYVDNSLAALTTYYYKVGSANIIGDLNYSNVASATTGGTYSAPTDSFTSGLAVSGSVDGSLSNGAGYTANQQVTFLNATSGRKYFMASANFSGANVDFSSLKIETSAGKIAVNASGVTGLYGTHTLWLPKTGDNSVYVCPNAVAVSEVSAGCSGVITFNSIGTQSGVTLSIDGSYWKIAGLTGSGGGEGGPVGVPEFSTITLLLALGIVAGGLVMIRRREY